MVQGLGDIQPLAKDLNVNAGSYQPSGWYAMGYISPDLRRSTVPEPLDFTYLKGVFPRGIMPTDTDLECEVNWNCLFIENKNPGERWSKGSFYSHVRKACLTGGTLVETRPTPCGVHEYRIIYHPRKGLVQEDYSPGFDDFCGRWAGWAKGNLPYAVRNHSGGPALVLQSDLGKFHAEWLCR